MNDNFYRQKTMTMMATLLVVLFLMTVFFGFWSYATHGQEELKDLANLGSFINMVVAISSIFTVGLVFYGVRVQGLEFQEMNQKLQDQIESSENQEKLNRTIDEIKQWDAIKKSAIDSFSETRVKEFANYFDWIDLIKSSDLSNKIDVELIENVIFSDRSTRSYLFDLVENLDAESLHLYENNQAYIEECDYLGEDFLPPNYAPRTPAEVSRYYEIIQVQKSLKKGTDIISGLYEKNAKLKLDDALSKLKQH